MHFVKVNFDEVRCLISEMFNNLSSRIVKRKRMTLCQLRSQICHKIMVKMKSKGL
jgi:hypothetical protein